MRASPDEWRKRVQRWRDSGLTAEEFAVETGLNANSLRCWKSKLKHQPPSLSSPLRPSPAAPSEPLPSLPLVEVRTTAGPAQGCFELQWGTRWRLQIPPAFEADSLRRLLSVLEQVP